jgi:hypothetical protein
MISTIVRYKAERSDGIKCRRKVDEILLFEVTYVEAKASYVSISNRGDLLSHIFRY